MSLPDRIVTIAIAGTMAAMVIFGCREGATLRAKPEIPMLDQEAGYVQAGVGLRRVVRFYLPGDKFNGHPSLDCVGDGNGLWCRESTR